MNKSIDKSIEIKNHLTNFVEFCKEKGVYLCKQQGEKIQKGEMNQRLANNEINDLMLEFLEEMGFEVKSEEEIRKMLEEQRELEKQRG